MNKVAKLFPPLRTKSARTGYFDTWKDLDTEQLINSKGLPGGAWKRKGVFDTGWHLLHNLLYGAAGAAGTSQMAIPNLLARLSDRTGITDNAEDTTKAITSPFYNMAMRSAHGLRHPLASNALDDWRTNEIAPQIEAAKREGGPMSALGYGTQAVNYGTDLAEEAIPMAVAAPGVVGMGGKALAGTGRLLQGAGRMSQLGRLFPRVGSAGTALANRAAGAANTASNAISGTRTGRFLLNPKWNHVAAPGGTPGALALYGGAGVGDVYAKARMGIVDENGNLVAPSQQAYHNLSPEQRTAYNQHQINQVTNLIQQDPTLTLQQALDNAHEQSGNRLIHEGWKPEKPTANAPINYMAQSDVDWAHPDNAGLAEFGDTLGEYYSPYLAPKLYEASQKGEMPANLQPGIDTYRTAVRNNVANAAAQLRTTGGINNTKLDPNFVREWLPEQHRQAFTNWVSGRGQATPELSGALSDLQAHHNIAKHLGWDKLAPKPQGPIDVKNLWPAQPAPVPTQPTQAPQAPATTMPTPKTASTMHWLDKIAGIGSDAVDIGQHAMMDVIPGGSAMRSGYDLLNKLTTPGGVDTSDPWATAKSVGNAVVESLPGTSTAHTANKIVSNFLPKAEEAGPPPGPQAGPPNAQPPQAPATLDQKPSPEAASPMPQAKPLPPASPVTPDGQIDISGISGAPAGGGQPTTPGGQITPGAQPGAQAPGMANVPGAANANAGQPSAPGGHPDAPTDWRANKLDPQTMSAIGAEIHDPKFIEQATKDPAFLKANQPKIEQYLKSKVVEEAEREAAKQGEDFKPEQWAGQKLAEIQNLKLSPESWQTAMETYAHEKGANPQQPDTMQSIMTYFNDLFQKAGQGDTSAWLQLGGYALGITGAAIGLFSAFSGNSIGALGGLVAGALGVAAGTGMLNGLIPGVSGQPAAGSETQPNAGGTGAPGTATPNTAPEGPSAASGASGAPQAPGTPPGQPAPTGQPGQAPQGSPIQDAISLIRQGQPLAPGMKETLSTQVPQVISELMKVPPAELPQLIANYKQQDPSFAAKLKDAAGRYPMTLQMALGINREQALWLSDIAKRYNS